MLKVALVGAGRMGVVHLAALRESAACEVVAAVEPDDQARANLSGEVPLLFETVEDLLDARVAEAALVAAPSTVHNQLVKALVAGGLAVMCEKPGGITVDEIRDSEQAARRAGVVLQFGYWRRFVPALRNVHDRFRGGGMGRLALVACHQWDHDLPSEEFRAHSGGIGPDMAVHEVDQVRWITGREIEAVTAVRAGGDEREDTRDPDGAVVLARLEGGTAAVITLGRRYPDADACWAELWADAGYARVEFMWGAESDRVFLDGMIAQANAFATAVQGGSQEGASADDAVAALHWASLIGNALQDSDGRWAS